MLLSELLVRDEVAFQKQGILATLPLAIHGGMSAPKEHIKGTAIGAAKGIPTDIGMLGGGVAGGLSGALLGAVAGALLTPTTPGASPKQTALEKRPGLVAGIGIGGVLGGAVGAAAGGYAGYSLGDYMVRKIIGEKRYKEIFDLERERKVKDKNVIT